MQTATQCKTVPNLYKSFSQVGSEAKNPLPTGEQKIWTDLMGLSWIFCEDEDCWNSNHFIEYSAQNENYQFNNEILESFN